MSCPTKHCIPLLKRRREKACWTVDVHMFFFGSENVIFGYLCFGFFIPPECRPRPRPRLYLLIRPFSVRSKNRSARHFVSNCLCFGFPAAFALLRLPLSRGDILFGAFIRSAWHLPIFRLLRRTLDCREARLLVFSLARVPPCRAALQRGLPLCSFLAAGRAAFLCESGQFPQALERLAGSLCLTCAFCQHDS